MPFVHSMASAPAADQASDNAGPPLLQLFRHQDLSLFLPFMLSLSDSDQHPSDPSPPLSMTATQPDTIVLINPITQGTVVLDSTAAAAESLLLHRLLPPPPNLMDSSHPPASSSSIEALPTVEVMAEAKAGGDAASATLASPPPCCVICLDDCGDWAKEMPCQHRFHGHCIERWLRIHGSCPVCRYRMPADEEAHQLHKPTTVHNPDTASSPDPDHQRQYSYYGRRSSDPSEIWVSFSFSRNAPSSG